MRMALFDTAHEKPIPLQLDGMFESAGIVGDTPDATAVEKMFLREGPKLVDKLILLRSRLMEDPSMIASTEGARMLEDFQQRYENLRELQDKFSEKTQPIVKDVLFQMNKFLEPLQKAAGGFQMQMLSQALKNSVGPMLAATAQNIQVVCGIAAAAEVLHITNKIRATCWKPEGQTTVRRAMLHMHRAESDVVSASSILDRILCDSMAERELDPNDINHFNIEQHDLAVQLANVRSQIESVRLATRGDINRHWTWGLRWGFASAVLSVAKQFLQEQAFAQSQGLALGASVSASVLNLIMTLLRKNTMTELEQLQSRHDEALSEHAGLHAQFSEVVRSCREAMSMTGGQREAVREGKLGSSGGEARANEREEGWQQKRKAEEMTAALRDLIDGLRRSSSGGQDAARDEGTVRALLPLLDRLAAAEAGNATLQEAQDAMAQAASLVRDRVAGPRASTPSDLSSGRSLRDPLRPSGLRRPSAVPGQDRASATPHPPDPVPRTPRRSRLRPPSVAAASATPPPLPEPAASQGVRASRLRPPSVALSVTPEPLERDSLTPRPAPASQLRRPSAVPTTPPPPGTLERWTPAPPARATPGKTPGAQLRATRRVAAGGGAVAGGGEGGERKLEEQLLQLVLMRMEITEDTGKREHLRSLASQLREATRAARQQVKASARTEAVLRDCVDAGLAQRIVAAQQDATAKTQEAMRQCLQETTLDRKSVV